MIDEEDLRVWKFNAGLIYLEVELFNVKWRKKNNNHWCDGMYISPDGKWYCKHLTIARNKNKKLNEFKKAFALSSPFIKESNILCNVAESLYRVNV